MKQYPGVIKKTISLLVKPAKFKLTFPTELTITFHS
jgi:hypothetical protein